MKKPKVLFLVNGLSPYRLDFFLELGKYCRLTVICEKKAAADRMWRIDVTKMSNFALHTLKGISTAPDMAFCPGVLRHILKRRYNIIVAANYNTPTGILAIAWMKLRLIPFAIECDGGFPKSGAGLKEALKRKLISSATWWLSTGKTADKYLEFYGAKKAAIYRYPFASVWHNEILKRPVDTDEKQRLKHSLGLGPQKLVLAVGSFIHRKGFDVLLEAWHDVAPDAQLCLIGGGPLAQDYARHIAQYQLEHIHIIPFQCKDVLIRYYKAADVFVLPTREDIWGLVVGEAMARGLAVITTDRCIAGLELVENGANGWVVPAGNAGVLAQKINELLADDTKSMAEASLRTISDYTIENMARVHMRIFEQITVHAGRRLIVLSHACSGSSYERAAKKTGRFIAQQTQKFFDLLLLGMAAHDGVRGRCGGVIAIARPCRAYLPYIKSEDADGIRYIHPAAPLGHTGFFRYMLKTVKRLGAGGQDSIVVDALSVTQLLAGLVISKRRGIPVIAVVLDVPMHALPMRRSVKGFAAYAIRTAAYALHRFVIRRCSAFVFLTAQMNSVLNRRGRPFIVMEGLVDSRIAPIEKKPSEKGQKMICMYAGALRVIYGLKMMTEAFIEANIPGAELHLYGDGDYVPEIRKLCQKHTNIRYFGVVSNEVVVDAERNAALLINPRFSHAAYTKYSFPSKTMEYMASGTPLLTTSLPGMPDEYKEYVYILEDETAEGLSRKLIEILAKPAEELLGFGERARTFVLIQKNNMLQASRLIALIDQCQKKRREEKAMNVLWVCNGILPQIAMAEYGEKTQGVGWITALLKEIVKAPAIRLTVCFPNTRESKCVPGKTGGFLYFGFPKRILSPAKYDASVEAHMERLVKACKPDIVHNFGTEFPHTLSMVRVCKRLGISDRVMIQTQGLISACTIHYYAHLTEKAVHQWTLRDILRRDNIVHQRQKFRQRGLFEIEAIQGVRHIIGRTDWDKACTGQINKTAQYHHCGENLRDAFYQNKWALERCTRHAIFATHCGYPIKGFHLLLEAMPLILKSYGDAHIYCTGSDPDVHTVLGRIRRTAYQRYLAGLMRRLGLQSRVTFLGTLDETQMCRQYLDAHVFVSPSSIENSSNSVAEAMLLGVPCVVSDVGGVKSMLVHNTDGLLHQADAPYMIANNVCAIFADDDAARGFSENARTHAARTHDREGNTARLLEIYRTVTEGSR